MRVVLAYTEIAPGVLDALNSTGWPYELADVSGSDDAYWQLLSGLWDAGETFAIVEHDVLVRPGTLAELAACPSPWCGYAVPYIHGDYPGLACAKFGASLIAAAPNAMRDVAGMSDDKHGPRHWCRVDAWLQAHVLPRTGIPRCIHQPSLGHVRPYDGNPKPSHGCIV